MRQRLLSWPLAPAAVPRVCPNRQPTARSFHRYCVRVGQMDRQAQARHKQGWTKHTIIRQYLPCHGRSQSAREPVPRAYHCRLTSVVRPPLLLCWQETVEREGCEQGVSGASWQNNTATTKNLPSLPGYGSSALKMALPRPTTQAAAASA